MRRALFAVVLALGACGGDAIVDLTVNVDPAVSDAELARVRSLTLDLTGLETATMRDPLAQPFANRTERVVVRSHASGQVMMVIGARDANDAVLLAGQISLTLNRGRETRQSVMLSPPPRGPSGGLDLAPYDWGPIDLAVRADLGALDQSSSDGSPPDLLSAGCPTGVLLCDGFESGIIDSGRWDLGEGAAGATIALDSTRAHRGQWSLHAHLGPVANGTTAMAAIGESNTFKPAGSSFFVRAWYYLSSPTTGTVTTLIDAHQNVPPAHSLSLAADHDALSIFDGFVPPGVYAASTTPKLPLNSWTCIEWQVETGTPNQVHVWIDGVKVPQLDLMETTTATPAIGALYVGLAMYPPNSSTVAVDAWIDDVIFDQSAIGCVK
jgi:hypothetical protein